MPPDDFVAKLIGLPRLAPYPDAEFDAFADRDREPPLEIDDGPNDGPNDGSANGRHWSDPPVAPAPRRGRRFAELIDVLYQRACEPFVPITIKSTEIARARLGSLVTLIGPSGMGKSTLGLQMSTEHATERGPALFVSYELDGDELVGREVGRQCDLSWEDALTGKAVRDQIRDLPRFDVLDGDDATLARIEETVAAMRLEYPDQPILIVVDYLQASPSATGDERLRIAAMSSTLRKLAKKLRVIILAVSQSSRGGAKQLRAGELLGTDSAATGAESAQIERDSYLVLALGGEKRLDDGTTAMDLNIGKARMGAGDRVWPVVHDGRVGRWRVTGEPRLASEVKAERAVASDDKRTAGAAHAVVGLLAQSKAPMSGSDVARALGTERKVVYAAIRAALADGRAVRVLGKKVGGAWPMWTPQLAAEHGVPVKTGDGDA